MGKWQPARFLTVTSPDKAQTGFVYQAVGLRLKFPASPKGRRPPMWSLYHLGTGHGLCHFSLHESDAFTLATEIAECGDGDFDGLDGWLNRDPDLKNKFLAILDAWRATHPKVWLVSGGGGQDPQAARRIAEARA